MKIKDFNLSFLVEKIEKYKVCLQDYKLLPNYQQEKSILLTKVPQRTLDQDHILDNQSINQKHRKKIFIKGYHHLNQLRRGILKK